MTQLAEAMRLVRRAERWEREAQFPGCRGLYIAAQLREDAMRILSTVQGYRRYPPMLPPEQQVIDYGE